MLGDVDRSTFLHEATCFFLEVHRDLAARAGAESCIRRDFQASLDWLGVRAEETPGSARNPMAMCDLATARPGQWLAEEFPDLRGTPVVQLRKLDARALADLYLPELDEHGRLLPDKRRYVPEYVARLERGEQAPPIRIVEMEDGRLRVVDGHRRVLSARQAGTELHALVSPLVEHEGAKVPLTKDLAPARTALETWRAMALAEKRDHHEKFARGFERYQMDSHAPTPQLQSMFGHFRSWLVSIYKSVTSVAVPLTPEVRELMGRMLAGDAADQVQRRGMRVARQQTRLAAMFTSSQQESAANDDLDSDSDPEPDSSPQSRERH